MYIEKTDSLLFYPAGVMMEIKLDLRTFVLRSTLSFGGGAVVPVSGRRTRSTESVEEQNVKYFGQSYVITLEMAAEWNTRRVKPIT